MSDCLHLWRPKVVAARPGFDSETPGCGEIHPPAATGASLELDCTRERTTV